jgi:hypothetical protein
MAITLASGRLTQLFGAGVRHRRTDSDQTGETGV